DVRAQFVTAPVREVEGISHLSTQCFAAQYAGAHSLVQPVLDLLDDPAGQDLERFAAMSGRQTGYFFAIGDSQLPLPTASQVGQLTQLRLRQGVGLSEGDEVRRTFLSPMGQVAVVTSHRKILAKPLEPRRRWQVP